MVGIDINIEGSFNGADMKIILGILIYFIILLFYYSLFSVGEKDD